MKQTRAQQLCERLDLTLASRVPSSVSFGAEEDPDSYNDSDLTFVFQGTGGGSSWYGNSGSTASTKNTRDQLRAMQLVSGSDYEWVSPFTLSIKGNLVNRDLLDVIQSEGGVLS